ncbi:hypothetical protein QJQ45_013320 [Haematococcus lacustris]|nr:hypothetical protein QJQ45_013320 [Haematococcus lacustris]
MYAVDYGFAAASLWVDWIPAVAHAIQAGLEVKVVDGLAIPIRYGSRPLALAYGAAGFSGSGTIGSRGVPVKQMQREACKQFPGRVVLVHEFGRVAAPGGQHGDAVPDPGPDVPNNHQEHQVLRRDVSAALNIRRIAAGPGRHCSLGRPAVPNPGRPGQEWVCVRDKGLLRKWQRRHQRYR